MTMLVEEIAMQRKRITKTLELNEFTTVDELTHIVSIRYVTEVNITFCDNHISSNNTSQYK